MAKRSEGEPPGRLGDLMSEKRRHYDEAKAILDQMASLVQGHQPIPRDLEQRLQACLARLRETTQQLNHERNHE